MGGAERENCSAADQERGITDLRKGRRAGFLFRGL